MKKILNIKHPTHFEAGTKFIFLLSIFFLYFIYLSYQHDISKGVITLACIDVFFSIIYALLNVWFFIPIIFGLCGYYGAKNFDKCLTYLYGANIYLVNTTRIIYSTYIYYNLSNEDKITNIYNFIIIILCGLIGLWISKMICKFYSSLARLTQDEINSLRLVRYLENSRTIYW